MQSCILWVLSSQLTLSWLLWAEKKATVTETSRYSTSNLEQQRTWHEVLFCQLRTGNWYFENAYQNWTLEVACSAATFRQYRQDGSTLPCIDGSGCRWSNGVRDILLAHVGLLSTNWASIICWNLHEYCWPCPPIYDHSVAIFWWLLNNQQNNPQVWVKFV